MNDKVICDLVAATKSVLYYWKNVISVISENLTDSSHVLREFGYWHDMISIDRVLAATYFFVQGYLLVPLSLGVLLSQCM